MADNNLGRVQGAGFFGASSVSETSIAKKAVQTNGVAPLIGDTIVNENGDLCKITAITKTDYIVTKYGSIKGAKGDVGSQGNKGDPGTKGDAGADAGFAAVMGVTVKTLGAEQNATVTVEADASTPNTAKKFNFVFGIPKGPKGEKGETGSAPLNCVTTDSDQTISGKKTFSAPGGLIVCGNSTYPYVRISNNGFGYAPSSASEYLYKLPEKGGTIALRSDIKTALDMYPIGSYYISNNSSSPSILFGGSWTSVTGRFLYCNGGYGTGGSSTHAHNSGSFVAAFMINPGDRMAALQHGDKPGWEATTTADYTGWRDITGQHWSYSQGVPILGTSEGASNMPPYQEVYAWRRTA